MGGEWDSTNVGDGQVAVFTPISLDHVARLGNTVAEIARTKSGIIKPAADVVTARQEPSALAELQRAAELTESSITVQGDGFDVVSSAVAVGGQLITVRGIADTYSDLFLPLYGDHQAQNASVAIAAVESFLGRGTQPLQRALLEEGLATATSPGRLQLIGTDPTVLVDAAHNPSGASTLAAAMRTYFDFDEIVVVLAILADKDAHGIVDALAPVASRFNVTQSSSSRALPHEDLTVGVSRWTRPDITFEYDDLYSALDDARTWAAAAPRRAVLVTGSIVLVGETIAIADDRGWKER